MHRHSEGDIDWRAGRAPLFVFGADRETYEVGRDAFFEFFSENALGRKRAFFGVGEMERDVLDYGLTLLNAPDGAEGAFTTGGSESLFLAMKAARDELRARSGFKPGDGPLNIVMPITGHPGMDKAAADKWVDTLTKLKKDKAFNKLIKGLGSIPDIRSPDDTKAFVKAQYETFRSVVQKLGIEVK